MSLGRWFAMMALCGWGGAGTASAQAVPTGAAAPAPVLLTQSGDSYKFLSELYHAGEDRPRDRRSAVALCFVGREASACAEALPPFMALAEQMQGREALRGKARFYVVGTDPLDQKDALAALLARHGVRPPVLTLLDPQRKACMEFGVENMPRTFVISKYGTLVADIEGAGSGYAKALATGVVKAVRDAGGAQRPARAQALPPPPVRGGAAAKDEGDPRQPMRW